MPIVRCPVCSGSGIRWKKVEVDSCNLHTVRCENCKGAGFLIPNGEPAHHPKHLGRADGRH